MTRTHDLLITNQLLYRLSYTSLPPHSGHLHIIHHQPRFVKSSIRLLPQRGRRSGGRIIFLSQQRREQPKQIPERPVE